MDRIVLFKQKQKSTGKLLSLPISSISPCIYQPRQNFDTEALEELAASIHQHGVLQPVPVRELSPGRYELIAGERRLRASILAGLTHIPAVVMDYEEKEVAALALVENLQRCDLNFFDEATGIARLITENDMTQEEASRIIGKSQPTIANKLRLLKLDEDLRSAINDAKLTERHARALLRLSPEQRDGALKKIIAQKLNVHATDALIDRMLLPPKPVRKMIIKDIRIFFNTVNKAVSIMKQNGIEAVSDLEELDNHYEYKIRIAKRK